MKSAIAEAASWRGELVPLLDCRMALAEANVKRIRELLGAGAAILPSADWQARNAELYRREAQVERDVEIILDIRRQLHMVYMASFGAKDGPDVSGPLGRWNYLQAILNPEQYRDQAPTGRLDEIVSHPKTRCILARRKAGL